MKQIVCFGDSNTWGYNPKDGTRYDENIRWTSVLQRMLGDQYNVVECGLNGRTTVFDEPFRECRNGLKGIGYSLLENKPIDLLIISLGTNDLKYTTAAGSAKGLNVLLRTVLHTGLWDNNNHTVFKDEPKILVILPIPFGENLDKISPDSMFRGKYGESLRLAELYKPVCDRYNVGFLDATQCAKPSEEDCLHMDPISHQNLAAAVFEKIKQMM